MSSWEGEYITVSGCSAINLKTSDEFITALNSFSIEGLRAIEKSDLHCHSGRSGDLKYLFKDSKFNMPKHPPQRFVSLGDMQEFYSSNIKKYFNCKIGIQKRWEASFVRAKEENIKVLALSFTSEKINFVGGMEAFVKIVDGLHRQFAHDVLFLPELTFERTCDVSLELTRLDEILEANWFRSIDICNDEQANSVDYFVPIYRKAKKASLTLKAHVGEFGTAEDIIRAVEVLELDEIHHGIAAAKSNQIMNWLAKHRIQLNICPSSNVMLGLVENYGNHPIRVLYDAGIPLTINTDNMLIFNQSVSKEYLNLFACGLMTAEELNNIRLMGLMKHS